MSNALKAGAAYFSAVFFVAFMLGTIRVIVMVPRLGELVSVSLEAPLIIAVSWLASRWATTRFCLPHDVLPRLAMGLVAFGLLMAVELAMSTLVFGQTMAAYFATIWSPAGMIGLSAQIVFAFVPLLQRIIRQLPAWVALRH